jgi:ectoine hydroxylase-related dioxygenase (phytanoyl-CoA dioxygenase family)
VVESLLGPDILVWASELFCKHPHDHHVAIGWHRDAPYLGFEGGQSVSAWVALNNSVVSNGCMKLLPRSVEKIHPPLVRSSSKTRGQLDVSIPEPHLVNIILGKGQMSLHASDVIHGSSPNLSDEKRIGFVIRYLSPETRPVAFRTPVVLARGVDRFNHFSLTDPPKETDPDKALVAMRGAAAQHLNTILENLKHACR